MTVIVRRVYRTGVQTLWKHGPRYFVSIQNRTYRSRVEIPYTAFRRWFRVMTEISSPDGRGQITNQH